MFRNVIVQIMRDENNGGRLNYYFLNIEDSIDDKVRFNKVRLKKKDDRIK